VQLAVQLPVMEHIVDYFVVQQNSVVWTDSIQATAFVVDFFCEEKKNSAVCNGIYKLVLRTRLPTSTLAVL